MTKLSVIFFILKQRVSNIILLAVMFSSLIVIFMVSLGIKDVFYNYLQSDYGNIPDIKIKINNLDDKTVDTIITKLHQKLSSTTSKIDILSGYEVTKNVSILDSEDTLLTKGLPLFIKGVKFNSKIPVMIDDKILYLEVLNISYQDEYFIQLKLEDTNIKDLQNIKLIADNKPLEYTFCKDITYQNNILTIKAKRCTDKIDTLLNKIDKSANKTLKVELDGEVFKTNIIEADPYYRILVVNPHKVKKAEALSLAYGDIEISNNLIDSFEIEDGELIINFKTSQNLQKNFKLYLSKILRDFINYHRMVLKLKLYSFEDDDKDDKQDATLVYLDELTDLLDIIFAKNMGTLAVSSSFLAQDLNNFGILDNFNIETKTTSFNINIRSTIEYNPEKYYNKNIIIVNKTVLDKYFSTANQNNYIDIYLKDISTDTINQIKSIVKQYDSDYKILLQEDIIPSIKAKKILFDSSFVIMSLFVLGILFVAMYIVLIQFYSNFNSELSLLKLYGSKIPYQTFVNISSFVISIGLNYIFLLKENEIINTIMLKYFFISYELNITDFVISATILAGYIFVIYLLEKQQIKKLNLIQGQ